MEMPFHQSLHALRRDRHRGLLVLGILLVVSLFAFLVWAIAAEVTVFETTASSRLESGRPVNRIDTPFSGSVASVHVALGDEVAEGELLFEMDTRTQKLEISAAQEALAGLQSQVAPLEEEIAAAESGVELSGESGQGAVLEARSRLSAARADATNAAEVSRRLRRLGDEGAIPEAEERAAQSSAQVASSTARAARHAVRVRRSEQQLQEADRRQTLASLRRRLAALRGEIGTTQAKLDRLTLDLERSAIRANISGRVAFVQELTPGQELERGAHVLSLLPTSDLRIVASFPPEAAFGRLKTGQRAAMRLHAYPWTSFGKLTATVTRVGNESTDGMVRVELAPDLNDFSVPLQHGLPGLLEVEVERASPAELVLRAAGHWLRQTKPADSRDRT